MFDSRFRRGEGVAFPLRQYMRCREEFSSGLFHLVLLVAFTVVLGSFGRTLNGLFTRHGDSVNPAWRWVALAVLGLFILSVLRRILYKVTELRDLRHEMQALKEEMANSSD
ncbi:hypothetical protein CSA17_03670 [bacterium DOLJORAL78_65_58]|nr:MAG: hypothetical protein CSB20_07575 [bacterium DOLZORAL124_64_63]PIE76157.1 MAG: hypothetical protein CSA17_03670 [bacterium DOLJORAL78_65_58]